MFEYLSLTKVEYRDEFEATMGKNPVAVWKALEGSAPAASLVKFTGLVFAIIINQAACERVFSEINGGINEYHLREGPGPTRGQRKNHDSVETLLAVPRYRDLLEDQGAEDESDRGRALVSSSAKWRSEMATWINKTDLFNLSLLGARVLMDNKSACFSCPMVSQLFRPSNLEFRLGFPLDVEDSRSIFGCQEILISGI
ncbi:hypothetical protein DFH09DRAFT_1090341 [Mycena vulgaris]|nr:hypothetical protein DFH09DRAFT_1090341 [Mycena vulgaris]